MPPPLKVRAAQYLRRSSAPQVASLEEQAAVIAAYAAKRGYRVVATFQDTRSGLDLNGRPGLQDLLAQAFGPAPGFSVILVQDVSRWGRFQDLDEGAHYEFLCRRAGIAVEYCAEMFENDGSLPAYLMKHLRRSTAAEGSRAISAQTVTSKRFLAKQGFFQSGLAPYGYRRMAISPEGVPKALLERGEHKAVSAYRTVLVPGPPLEVATVARIFRLFAITGLRRDAIAAILTEEGIDPVTATTWNGEGLRRLLRNPVYAGDYVFGRSESRLRGPVVPAPPERWVRVPDAFPALVSRDLFEAAQRSLPPRRRRTDAEMLDDLRALLATRGRVDSGLIDECPTMLGSCAYIARFGGLRRAYAMIGYRRGKRAPARGSAVAPPPEPRADTPAQVRAAQYVRVSRDVQKSSIPGQMAEIAAFAEAHGYRIVRSYCDIGRSGLRLKGRAALQQLLAEITAGQADYAAVLVQDVSRWGRFQDPDEAAHYEFLCRAAGVEVRYVAEPFADAATPAAPVMKGAKRMMAADFSLQLSDKVRRAHRRGAAAGHKMGGAPGFGLRRRIVGLDGVPGPLLGPGEMKVLQSQHVVLEWGPPEEVETVRRIFRLYARDGLSFERIATRLNAEGVRREDGRPWRASNVGLVLNNVNYLGETVLGRRPRDLEGRRALASPETWVRRSGVLPPMVSREIFDAVRAKRANWRGPIDPVAVLRRAAEVLAKDGRLSQRALRKPPSPAGAKTIHSYFGPLNRLQARLGVYPPAPGEPTSLGAPFLPGCIDDELEALENEAPAEFAQMPPPSRHTLFQRDRLVASGPLVEVARAAKLAHDLDGYNLIVFADDTGAVVDLDLRGTLDEVLARLPENEAEAQTPGETASKPGRGRPKLGVAAREVTLLPRHWDWLARQSGGASAAIRRLVEQAAREGVDRDAARQAQTAAYKVLYALAGHLPRYEDVLRALFGPDPATFETLTDPWPEDVRTYVRRLADLAFERLAD